MTSVENNSVLQEVDLHSKTNNEEHHTSELSEDKLIVRRGQSFKMTVKLTKPFKPDLHSLLLTATTGGAQGEYSSEDQGTLSRFGIPDYPDRSPTAKAIWTVQLHDSSSLMSLILLITPPPDTPIGKYTLTGSLWDEEIQLATLVVLFNPWFSGDSVFMSDKLERQEYVMNEQGVIYRGSTNYISGMNWDFGHFEDDMVDICLMILDKNLNYTNNPSKDLASRGSPIYISRVVSAMINNFDDPGVLQGNWSDSFEGGVSPSHWSGSHDILSKWIQNDCQPVKFGQCWVFAGVMCSVMRLLGIPTRVITNFQSAHDTDANLTIDVYHPLEGAEHIKSDDSIWNFHVWVESWMTRPDLNTDGKYDGWQVLDPTPQEASDGIYQCGPASVIAIHDGEINLPYDIPFVFAEVNADCVDWIVISDGTKISMFSDTKRVGKKISTKVVGSKERENITRYYKPEEGSEEERAVFKYAISKDEESDDEVDAPRESMTDYNASPEPPTVSPPLLVIHFEELSKPQYGEDVRLNLVLSSESKVERQMSLRISVKGMKYNGTLVLVILNETKEETLKPGKKLSIPILIPFQTYYKHMHVCDSLKVTAMVTDMRHPDKIYLAEDNVLLQDLPVHVSISGYVTQHQEASGTVSFVNTTAVAMTGMTLALSGSGLMKKEMEFWLPDLPPKNRIRVGFVFVPYRAGEKTLVADIHSSIFKDFKGNCTFKVNRL
ncbi:protein-glutamine gamma-glutamyltransferase E-like isoform X2 [Nerophis lumbriciformis]|uniref:protein-glutamine gamma-glutamyltransferase E-like isoform X2 n=1 Tax=Nerophis lumbriciformis TaxID=546530 RepID=UPI002ADF4308|nr:protein-glutamine gamma-glutamyltransferase E-like isoform X2 [Nerophis lumbriciformis]